MIYLGWTGLLWIGPRKCTVWWKKTVDNNDNDDNGNDGEKEVNGKMDGLLRNKLELHTIKQRRRTMTMQWQWENTMGDST